ncbi:MAG: ABC transporter ATP-binding protein [Candidatus Heimdallarchaeota archaeon]|nr:ABC transporter ATP-binding protein [Candidatus Heimdallarchaeota archaeon]MDH5646762.1 ABC transporter ATP-binding protein [Candidatus Heimdallarchaeota archaeon]
MKPIIQTKGLYKTYKGRVEALKNLDMVVNKGDSLGLLGPNGAGKTTTIQIILNLINQSKGEVELFGENIKGQENRLLQKVGALVGTPGYYDKLTPNDFLMYVCKTHLMNKAESQIRIKEVLNDIGLSEVGTKKVGTFSTGMKRRLGLAQILVHDPELIILDEPTNGLDPKGVREVRDLIKNINKMGKTIFMTSHNLTEVDEISSRVIFLNHGEKVGDEKISDLRKELGFKKIQVKFLRDLNSGEKEIIQSIDKVKGYFEVDNPYIEYDGDISATHDILKEIMKEKLPIFSYNPQTLTLEDIYFKIFGNPSDKKELIL